MLSTAKPMLAENRLRGEIEAEILRYRDTLEQEAFLHLSNAQVRRLCGEAELNPLLMAADSAPVDPYSDGFRRRYYGTAIYYPWSNAIRFDDVFTEATGTAFVPYYQPATINGDAGGKERRFAPLPRHLEQDDLLVLLIRAFFSMLPGDMIERRLPVRVGLHLIRLFSDGRRIGLPSPNTLHTDGEPWTAITLIDRFNVAPNSAKSYVARRDCRGRQPQDLSRDDIYFEGTLSTPLETVIVDDARVSHAVTGCLGANCQPGWRTSLLIDYSGMVPYRTS